MSRDTINENAQKMLDQLEKEQKAEREAQKNSTPTPTPTPANQKK